MFKKIHKDLFFKNKKHNFVKHLELKGNERYSVFECKVLWNSNEQIVQTKFKIKD